MTTVQEIIFRNTDYLRRAIAPVGGQRGVTMSYLCPNCNSFPLEDYVWWVSGKKTTKWWCAICGQKYDWRQPNRLLVVKFWAGKGDAPKLLANYQEDGNGLLQNILKDLGKGSRRGLTDGLRHFIRVDNEHALDVWALRRCTQTFEVRKPKVPWHWELKNGRPRRLWFISTTLKRKKWSPFLGDADWYAFCQALYKGIEGKDCEEMYDSYKVMSKAVGVKKPQEAQKAKTLCTMKAAKDRKEKFYDLARKDNILGRNETRLELWKTTSKIQLLRSLKCVGRSVLKLARSLVEVRQQWPAIEWRHIWCYRRGKRSCGLFWMRGIVCVCAHSPRNGMSQGGTGRMASSSSSFLKKGPMVLRELVRCGPSIPVEAVKTCALVGLHMMAEEDSWRMDSDSSFSSSSSSENNVGNGALCVIGVHWSGGAIAHFLQDWEVAEVALSCTWTCCAWRRSGCVGFWACLVLQKGKEVNDMPSERFLQICFSVNIVAVWDEGLSLVEFATVLCE